MKWWLPGFFVCLINCAIAQSYFQTGLLQGPHRVGFKAGIHYDLGRPAIKEQFSAYRKGRAIHISAWYPAVVKANAQKMLYHEYVDEIARMVNPVQVNKKTRFSALHQMNLLLSQLGGDSTLLKKHINDMMTTPTGSFRNAMAREGDFPIIIYPESSYLNNILSEYLASYGYIVVSVSRHGTQDTEFEWQNIRGIETLIQDCQFALSVIRTEFNIDNSQFAVMGTGINASAGLAWMMRNNAVNALISLEGGILTGYEYQLLQQSPYYNITSVAKPMLVIHSPHESVNPDLVYNYKCADRYVVSLPQSREFYYLNFGVWEKSIPGILGPAPGDTKTSYEWMARYTLYFLDWQLKHGFEGKKFFEETPEQLKIPSGIANYQRIAAIEAPPTTQELLQLKKDDGFDAMLKEATKHIQQDSMAFSPDTYSAIGRELVTSGSFKDGVQWAETFKKRFPESVTAYTLAGRCLLELGLKGEARAMYTTALHLLPGDEHLSSPDKDQLKTAIEGRLRQLAQ